ncbi:hypothetical protein CHU98_g2563 [Xylaria longipes]|nr:hypothetical protein CHU98_g2563 [Xylaria longipes]
MGENTELLAQADIHFESGLWKSARHGIFSKVRRNSTRLRPVERTNAVSDKMKLVTNAATKSVMRAGAGPPAACCCRSRKWEAGCRY